MNCLLNKYIEIILLFQIYVLFSVLNVENCLIKSINYGNISLVVTFTRRILNVTSAVKCTGKNTKINNENLLVITCYFIIINTYRMCVHTYY